MQEQMNKAMASLSETVGEDVPTIDEVRDKIEARYAKAKGMAELQGESVEGRMLEVEQAAAEHRGPGPPLPDPGPARPRPRRGGGPTRSRSPHRAEQPPQPRPRSKRPASDPPTGFCVEIGRPSNRFATQNRASTGIEDEVVAVDDLGGCAGGELRAALPGGRGHHRGAHPHQPLGEHLAVGVGHLDRVVRREGAADLDHAGREQRAPVRLERPAGARVDDDPTG